MATEASAASQECTSANEGTFTPTNAIAQLGSGVSALQRTPFHVCWLPCSSARMPSAARHSLLGGQLDLHVACLPASLPAPCPAPLLLVDWRKSAVSPSTVRDVGALRRGA